MDKNEPKTYWEKRCWINEQILEDLANMVADSFPHLSQHINKMLAIWDDAIDKIEEDHNGQE